MTITPKKPIITPITLCGESRSSFSIMPATITPVTPVAPLSILERPEVICVCPQNINEKGIALLSVPMTRYDPQTLVSLGKRSPRNHIIRARSGMANMTRNKVRVIGGTSCNAIAAKKNELPQIKARPVSNIALRESILVGIKYQAVRLQLGRAIGLIN